jgi:Uma2 family endonuclease
MNIALRNGTMTVQDYLAWAETQGEGPRTELINGQIVAMSPERLAHNRAKGAAFMALRRAMDIAGIGGEVLTGGVTVPIDDHTAYEPDAMVYCGEPLSGSEMKVSDPLIVVEVISPTSRHTDTSAKLIGYFKLPSMRHYLVIDPEARTVTHHARTMEGTIAANTLAAGNLRLDPPGIAVEIADLMG